MLNGDVTIEKPQLKGIEEGGEEQWLIIFANGNTHIRNNSVNQDKPSTIHVFSIQQAILKCLEFIYRWRYFCSSRRTQCDTRAGRENRFLEHNI
ncbi:hypothetical protein [Virgibacillus dokdonensis]|uniref:Uncharacterized protein n=1 Tax=Virgibacillus dokdonensis TaxID=302167 RepID=A0A2K9IVB5_9BACI|nr:hypothetical protein [Virgibacillus dokdonensis]AUJ23696.1 hypothetical protein A21D_00583 [Virgibacillus dokdonensis]